MLLACQEAYLFSVQILARIYSHHKAQTHLCSFWLSFARSTSISSPDPNHSTLSKLLHVDCLPQFLAFLSVMGLFIWLQFFFVSKLIWLQLMEHFLVSSSPLVLILRSHLYIEYDPLKTPDKKKIIGYTDNCRRGGPLGRCMNFSIEGCNSDIDFLLEVTWIGTTTYTREYLKLCTTDHQQEPFMPAFTCWVKSISEYN